MKPLIIIPAYNEAENIAFVINDIKEHFQEADILVVNDGSTDSTGEIAKTAGVTVINHPFNMGIGASVQEILHQLQTTGESIAGSTTKRIQIDLATWGICRYWTPPSPQSCNIQSDCGPGQWCLNNVCGPPPFSEGCRHQRDCHNATCNAARNVGTRVEILGRCDDDDPDQLDPDLLPPGAHCFCVEY